MKYKWHIILISICFLQISCEEFVDVNLPDNKIVSETVFSNDETANSAVIGIYNELFNADFSRGGPRSITMLGGLSADELQTTVLINELDDFEQNEILIDNSYNLSIWSSAYNIIYMCNNVIEGLQQYEGVSAEMKDRLMGEAKFIRAFTYFYLVNLYGEVPLVSTTDYRKNAVAARTGTAEIYEALIDDLESAVEVLDGTYGEGERLRATKFTATALLARAKLYLQNWEEAEVLSSEVINTSENYSLLNNLDAVFLANSREAIWQISPAGGGQLSSRTNEAYLFVLTSPPPQSQTPVALSNDFMAIYGKGDLRAAHWVGMYGTEDEVYYYPFKYKKNSSSGDITEYSMAMRFAEQYLIRAEARAQQGKLTSAIADLDKIRERANLNSISSTFPDIGQKALLDSIYLERRRELFTEWGHRWLDLKRTGTVSEVLSALKPSWQDTDILYPIPEEEIGTNPNLTQNNGY